MATTQIVPVTHVSLSDALQGPMGQKAVRLRPDDLPEGISIVRVPGVGRIPAVVALRTTLDAHHQTPGIPPVYQWKVVISPHEENLLRRLFGRTRGELDEAGVRYEIVPRLRLAHNELSLLQPPQGTVLQVTFAFDKQGDPQIEWFASSIEASRRAHREALNKNQLVVENAWPFGWLVTWRKIGLVDVPPIPENDLWVTESQDELARIVSTGFLPTMESLWRATFMEGDVGAQLKAEGYELGGVGRTRIGLSGLGTIVRDRRGRLTHLTQLHLSPPLQQP